MEPGVLGGAKELVSSFAFDSGVVAAAQAFGDRGDDDAVLASPAPQGKGREAPTSALPREAEERVGRWRPALLSSRLPPDTGLQVFVAIPRAPFIATPPPSKATGVEFATGGAEGAKRGPLRASRTRAVRED